MIDNEKEMHVPESVAGDAVVDERPVPVSGRIDEGGTPPDARTPLRGLTPRERWGTCCPNDPNCDHSFMDDAELTRHMDTPMGDIGEERGGAHGYA